MNEIMDQKGPVIVLSQGRSGSTMVQRLINSVKGWYLFGEHGSAFRHFYNFQSALATAFPWQERNGELIVNKAPEVSREFLAWASPFALEGFDDVFMETFLRSYTAKLPNRCIWGFKEIGYTPVEALLLSEHLPGARVIVLRRPFEDYCRSWCNAFASNIRKGKREARQLALSYLGFHSQMQAAAKMSIKPFEFVSYDDVCADPQQIIDVVARSYDWVVDDEDRQNVAIASALWVDSVSAEAKKDGLHQHADFVAMATDFYLAGASP